MTFPFRHPFLTTIFVASAIACQAQDPLDSWARRIVPGFTGNLQAVAYGSGVFVAVGDNSTVARSADGVEWTIGTAGAYGNLARVRFLNDLFMVVGSSDKLLLSPDGINWIAVTLPVQGFWDVAYGDGTYVLAGNVTYVSTNGVDWIQTFPRLPSPFGPYVTALDSVVFGDNVFVALATGGSMFTPRPSLRSTNGIDWIPTGLAPQTPTGGTGDLLFADNRFLGVGSVGGSFKGVSLSTNGGVSWCCDFFPPIPAAAGDALAYGQGHYLWTRHWYSSRPNIWSSTNGTDWVLRYSEETSLTYPAAGAAFGRGTFVVVGSEGYIVQSGSIGGLPSILVQPQDRSALAGNPASFGVLSFGEPPLAYHWFHNDSPIANATNTSYTIPAVAAGDTGGYKVVITNSFGSVTSRVAQLSVSFLDIKSYAGIQLLGVVGRTYRIEATPASGPVNWQTLTNLVLPASPYIWIDYGSPAAGQRLYRAAELP